MAARPTRREGGHITKAQREQFLQHITDGMLRPDAARAVHETFTGSMFRAIGARDPDFADAYQQALEQGHPGLQDRVRKAWHETALEGKNPRLLWYLIVSTLPEAAWFRQGKADDDGKVTSDLTGLTDAELADLRALVAKARPDGPARLHAV